ncbi:hypothetical protein IE81DRAFT_25888 [Ceraceosorus guamensis]|uniref:Uncharacterized protein n=1 Tax=Ceraceosorus guamensis TaxID=1522189 RepID=A0A316VPF4_9BASI|nr:hypothetical protein IE81DRAFT_25888 [Ceraceosorus guamensis]PWN39456.1 hypothetical protein IE81DRAFT_25888 [Ceraceosorus guamensis]
MHKQAHASDVRGARCEVRWRADQVTREEDPTHLFDRRLTLRTHTIPSPKGSAASYVRLHPLINPPCDHLLLVELLGLGLAFDVIATLRTTPHRTAPQRTATHRIASHSDLPHACIASTSYSFICSWVRQASKRQCWLALLALWALLWDMHSDSNRFDACLEAVSE